MLLPRPYQSKSLTSHQNHLASGIDARLNCEHYSSTALSDRGQVRCGDCCCCNGRSGYGYDDGGGIMAFAKC